MAAYTSTAGDVEAGVEERTLVVVEERRVPAAWMWKASGALLMAALCFGGVLLCAWFWSESPERTVRSVSTFSDKESLEKLHL